jgi:hypothetical protein
MCFGDSIISDIIIIIAFGIKYYTEEQRDTLLSLFGYYDGVNDTQVTHVKK